MLTARRPVSLSLSRRAASAITRRRRLRTVAMMDDASPAAPKPPPYAKLSMPVYSLCTKGVRAASHFTFAVRNITQSRPVGSPLNRPLSARSRLRVRWSGLQRMHRHGAAASRSDRIAAWIACRPTVCVLGCIRLYLTH
jgi:hypothetical protein